MEWVVVLDWFLINERRSILVWPRTDVFSSLAFLSLGRTSRNVTACECVCVCVSPIEINF